MASKSTDILKGVNQLISLVDSSGIQKTDKLKIIKVLLAIKLKIMELLAEEISLETKFIHIASLASHERSREGPSRTKQDAEHVRGFVRDPQLVSASYVASYKKEKKSDTPDKQKLILEFIRNKSGQVGTVELLELGIAGRSLRRYLKSLKDKNKIKIEKRGREIFYSVIAKE